MRRYNKLSRHLWTEGAMAELEPPACCPSALYLYLMTCDRPTVIAGLTRGPAVLAEDTGWDYTDVIRDLGILESRGFVIRSRRPGYVLAPAALEFDSPEPGNATTGAEKCLQNLPSCAPVDAAIKIVAGEALPEGVLNPLAKGVGEGVPKGDTKPVRSTQYAVRSTQNNNKPEVAVSERACIEDLAKWLGAGIPASRYPAIADVLPYYTAWHIEHSAGFARSKSKSSPVGLWLSFYAESGYTGPPIPKQSTTLPMDHPEVVAFFSSPSLTPDELAALDAKDAREKIEREERERRKEANKTPKQKAQEAFKARQTARQIARQGGK